MIEHLRPGFKENVLDPPDNWIGVRPLRIMGLPALAAIWTFLLWEVLSRDGATLTAVSYWQLFVPVFVAVGFTPRLWRASPNI